MNIMADGRSSEHAERYDKCKSISVTQENRSLGVASWVIIFFSFKTTILRRAQEANFFRLFIEHEVC